jgi:hypothetical protein
MDQKIVAYDGNGITGRVVVSAANVLQGLKRTRLRNQHGPIDSTPEEVLIAQIFTYPDLVAAAKSIEIDGLDGEITFEQFAALPEALVLQWEQAVYELNPHWLPQETTEKKE